MIQWPGSVHCWNDDPRSLWGDVNSLSVLLINIELSEIDSLVKEELNSVMNPFLPKTRAAYLFWPSWKKLEEYSMLQHPSLHFGGLHNLEVHSNSYRPNTKNSRTGYTWILAQVSQWGGYIVILGSAPNSLRGRKISVSKVKFIESLHS